MQSQYCFDCQRPVPQGLPFCSRCGRKLPTPRGDDRRAGADRRQLAMPVLLNRRSGLDRRNRRERRMFAY